MAARSTFRRTVDLEASSQDLAEWHFRQGAIHRLIPPWENIVVRREASPLVDGARAEIEIRKGPFRTMLVAVHSEVERGRQFVDRQERGPFGSWRHLHRFIPRGAGSTLEDSIEYDPPFGLLGRLGDGILRREIARQFAFRHARTREDLLRHREFRERFGARVLRIGVTGANGLVGRQLCAFLTTGGHEVVRFVRGEPKSAAERRWNPSDPEHGMSAEDLADLDAVVHLAGEGIAEGRWTVERKRSIRDSRTLGTAAVARAVAKAAAAAARADGRAIALVSASAVGYYGDRGAESVDEQSAPGSGYLPDVVRAWEDATVAARNAGVRTVHARLGVVLSASGGALAKMRLPFSVGAGGPVGSGRQGMSWISLDDAVAAIAFATLSDGLRGAVNLVAPEAMPQREFARTLGRVLGRPAFAPLPSMAVRVMFGEMGQRLLLEGAFVRPAVLLREGFRFSHPRLEDALRLELGRLSADRGGAEVRSS